eukprot:TRINITY_DN0_c1764_g1_i2.p1 TRINITY_DN0_c1764_g1~~TRINITY_DN0_c1764_g1_i2.p1  ORF type:complete len:204 (+),score=41.58 TRINITY_DN0_c1764_g1_i2:2-613(+)
MCIRDRFGLILIMAEVDLDSPLRLKPWFALTEEERAFIVFRAYRSQVVSSDEVKSLLSYARYSYISNVLFPVLTYPIASGLYPFLRKTFLAGTRQRVAQGVGLGLFGLSWLTFFLYNPFTSQVVKKREDLLGLIERRIGFNLLNFNDVLPRWYTTTEIHRQMRKVYNQRHSIFTNILYPPEEYAEPLVDTESWPKPSTAKNQK